MLKKLGLAFLFSIIGLLAFIFFGFLFFSYNDKTIKNGCKSEFCTGQTKDEVKALFEGKYSFNNGVLVPFDPSIKPSKYSSNQIPKTLDELYVHDRWTIVYDKKYGWTKFVHLKFAQNEIKQIDIVNYGPFYIDP